MSEHHDQNISSSTCANCGASLPVDTQICPVCGASNKHAGPPIKGAKKTLWLKTRKYIRLAGISFAALLIFPVLLFIALGIMLARIGPPFNATEPSAVTPGLSLIH